MSNVQDIAYDADNPLFQSFVQENVETRQLLYNEQTLPSHSRSAVWELNTKVASTQRSTGSKGCILERVLEKLRFRGLIITVYKSRDKCDMLRR